MKILITFLLIAVTSFSKSQPFTMQWQNVTGSYPILSVYRAIAATSDINNDFLITGLKDTAISQMIFLNKYHADGSVIFEKKYPEYYCLASSICTDPSGNIYIGGWNYSSDTSKILILKYDSTGNYLWNFSENVNFDSGNDRFEIKLSVDPVGTLYYGFHNADSLINWKLKCGKLNPDGTQAWEYHLPSNANKFLNFELRQDNAIEFITGSGVGVSYINLYDTSFNFLRSWNNNNSFFNGAFIDSLNNTFITMYTTDSIFQNPDSDIVMKLDPNFNLIWEKALPGSSGNSKNLIKKNGNFLYWWNGFYLIRLDQNGNTLAQATNGSIETFEVGNTGNVYSSYSGCFKVFDSSLTIIKTKCIPNYIYPITTLNRNSDFLSALYYSNSLKYRFMAGFYNQSLTDSTIINYTNYQHNSDESFSALMDYEKNLIQINRYQDSILYPGTAIARPGLNITKYDTSGNLLWQKNVHISGWNDFNYSSSTFDIANNIYVCGISDSSANDDYFAFIVKISADGNNITRYFYLNALGRNEAKSIKSDSVGNVYLAGTEFTGIGGQYDYDGFITKLDSMLNPIWTHRIPIQTGAYEMADNIVLKNGKIDFTVYSVSHTLRSNYIYEYDSTGNLIRNFLVNQSSSPNYGCKMVMDSSDNFIVAGITDSTYWYLTKMDYTGNVLCEWTNNNPLSWANKLSDLQLDKNGDCILTGSVATDSSYNYLTCKFTNCTMQWADSLPEAAGNNISIANNNIYIGTKNGNFSFITVYDSLGTILYRENFQTNFLPITINADSSFFYTSSIIKTDSGSNDILTRKYLNDFTSNVPRVSRLNDIKVYPNPATKIISINSGELKLKRISFFNLANQYLYSQELNSSDQTNTIVLPEFLKGELIYRTTDEKGRVYSGKLTLIR